MKDQDLLTLTADIVSAYISNNQARTAELPDLIAAVHTSLLAATEPKAVEAPPAALVPAVSVKKSIHDDYLICLDDGKKFKSLKRHLSQLGMTPEEYRAKWALPRDYPMVAPGYAAKRSELAKASGLGSGRRGGGVAAIEEAAPEPEEEATPAVAAEPIEPEAVADVPAEPEAPAEVEAPKRRGRPKKAA